MNATILVEVKTEPKWEDKCAEFGGWRKVDGADVQCLSVSWFKGNLPKLGATVRLIGPGYVGRSGPGAIFEFEEWFEE